MRVTFPEGFLWGAATSAHQVEGGMDNDWTEWELANAERLADEASPRLDYGCGPLRAEEWLRVRNPAKDFTNYLSGDGIDHVHRWREDIELASSLGLRALRYSVEWSRIQPDADLVENRWIHHYIGRAIAMRELGIEPIITLHHFTNPKWFSRLGGWERPEAPHVFQHYVSNMAVAAADAGLDSVHWVVANEPELYATKGWVFGDWPPNKKFSPKSQKVIKHFAEAHKRSRDTIKAVDPTAMVSSAPHVIDFEAKKNILWPANKLAVAVGRGLLADQFSKRIAEDIDFVALNHYLHCVVNVGRIANNMGLFQNGNVPRSDLGWPLNPESMYNVLIDAGKKKLPVIITENGIATRDDALREKFTKETLYHVNRAMQEGVDVRGYLHWSLFDNFEWPPAGWWAKFGLVSVDPHTMERTVKPSGYAYSDIAKNNGFEIDASL